MTGWSSSHFLQSLGWAILNSFWQMALLWILFLAVNHFFKLNAAARYRVAVAGVGTGFVWFLFTFFYYLQTSPVSSIAIFNNPIEENNRFLQVTLFSASIAYLSLLIIPSYKLYRNWRFVRTIRQEGLSKAGLGYRLFVQKIGSQLGITKKVMVYASELVKSPVTIGYLKPIILVPVAALNNLSTQQVEAILLHELSHIRRYDYLVNFMISIVNTILYFNPFVKQFIRTIEEERENCCDELVLQYGYDKLGYASALLTLEKLSAQHQVLALCARGKNYLLARIEKIAGIEKKKSIKLNHLAGLIAALFCIFAFNSVLIIREKKETPFALAVDHLGNAFNFFNTREETGNDSETAPMVKAASSENCEAPAPPVAENTEAFAYEADAPIEETEDHFPNTDHSGMFMRVAQDDIDAALSAEEKAKIRSTLAATQKIITTMQWKELDKAIGDAMNQNEKMAAKKEYLQAFEKQEKMKLLEQNLKARYEKLDWDHINENMNKALVDLKLDSLQEVYTNAIVQLEKLKVEACVNGKVSVSPLPDQSVEAIAISIEGLKQQVEVIRAARQPKKVVKL